MGSAFVLTVLAVVLLIALLIVLISWGRVPPFAAFIATSLIAALCFGMPLPAVAASIERGVGDMLGGVAAIICLGAMFGRTIADSGAARSIANALIGAVGVRLITVALALTGLIVGIPLFYSVGFVIMVPLIFSLAARTRLPIVYVAIPLLCGLSVAHGFLPPHPSPIALVNLFAADLGLTLIYGMIVGGVTVMIAGPMLALTLKGITPRADNQAVSEASTPFPGLSSGPTASLVTDPNPPEKSLPGPLNSCFTALLPVLLIATTTAVAYVPHASPQLTELAAFIGQPIVALMASLVYATVSLGIARGIKFKTLMQANGVSLQDVSGILLTLAGAGALKQVFVDGGVSAQLGEWLQTVPLQPLVLGWLIAVVIRIALGSATIAGLTAAGIMAPVAAASGVDSSLMVLAIGAGSLMCSHVNDAGFWLFKEYFNLSLRDTFRSWTVMESLAGVVGLVCVLILNEIVVDTMNANFAVILLLVSGITSAAEPAIIPWPVKVTSTTGFFTVDEKTTICAATDAERAVAEQLQAVVKAVQGLDLKARDCKRAGIALTLSPTAAVDDAEGYTLDVSAQGVRIEARAVAGLYYGAVTLAQLLSGGAHGVPVQLGGIHIEDFPRFRWRGLMLDSARHFFPVADVKMMLEQMGQHKLNVLHLHLTDDQGWRIEIQRYPELTKIGAWRTPPSNGRAGATSMYGGFYTQEDIREIVRYAAARHITIVPEIDFPGHAQAVVAAHPKLSVLGDQPKVGNNWGVNDYLYNTDEYSLAFVKNVLDEVMRLFPGKYIHLGGDEAIKDQWQASPAVQAQLKSLGLANEDELQNWFMQQIGRYLADHGRDHGWLG